MMRAARLSATLCVATLLAACSPRQVVHHLSGETMGTTYNVKFVGPDDPELPKMIGGLVDLTLQLVNERFSTWIDDSLISSFNAHRSTEPFRVNAEFLAVLEQALQVAEWSEGAYDPTALPLVRLYGFGPGGERVPPDEAALAAAMALVDWRGIEILAGDRLRKRQPGIEIDLSSIAKGTGVDELAALLIGAGRADFMVEIGGEVRCGGSKPGGEPWRVGIEKPEEGLGRPVQEVVELRDRALATSGDYRNWFEAGGSRIHHVLDARSGVNADNGVIQVSVQAADCATADALATAWMIVGPDAAARMLERPELAGVEALFLLRSEDGEVITRRLP